MLPPRRHTATLVLALLSLAAPPQATALKFADLFGGSASISSNASSTPSTSPAASAAASATQISGDTVFSMFRSVLGMGTSAQSSSLPRPTPSNSLLEGIDSVASPLSSIFDNAATVNSAISTSTSRNRPKHRPLSCTSYRGANEACGPTQGQCCQNGFTCADNVCKQLCPLSTYQPYCASSDDCDSSLGFTCISNVCTKPPSAKWAPVNGTCDQGAGNTQYCLPLQAVCVEGVCEPCLAVS